MPCLLMLTTGKQLVVFSVKSRESAKQLLYHCNFLSASFRIGYFQLNLLRSLKTCFYNNVLKVCTSVATYYTIAYI